MFSGNFFRSIRFNLLLLRESYYKLVGRRSIFIFDKLFNDRFNKVRLAGKFYKFTFYNLLIASYRCLRFVGSRLRSTYNN